MNPSVPSSAWRLPAPPRGLARILLSALMLVALFLRIYDLSRVPPGLFYDEAAATLLAGPVASGQALPIFISNYTGHEVLYYYLTIPLIKLLGVTILALRLTSAVIGAVTVLMAYVLGRQLFAGEPTVEPEWLGLFAAALMATSFWHVSVSRYGYRAITLPLMQSLLLCTLWRGLGLNRWRWFVTAGVLCGLTAYTYLSSRMVPLALAILGVAVLLADRAHWRRQLARWGTLALVATGVFAPLGVFFATHPETFFERASQVSIFSSSVWQTTAAQNTLRVLQVFTVRGDPQMQFNLAEQPLFQGVFAIAFYVGLSVILLRMLRPGGPWSYPRYLLIVTWPLMMLIPSILSNPQQIPHSLRSIGMLPFVFYVPALGLVIALGALQRIRELSSPRRMTVVAASVLVVLLAVSATQTFGDYFLRWAVQPRLYYENNGDVADMARYLDSFPKDGRAFYVHMLNWYHPTVQVLARSYNRIKWVQGDGVLVFSPGPAVYAWPRDSWPDESWVGRFFPPQTGVTRSGPDGAPAFAAYSLDRPPVISPTHSLSGTFGGIIQAIGYDVLRDRPSGGKTDLVVYWRVLRTPDRNDYGTLITLSDAWGAEWGRGGGALYPSDQWTPGEVLAERIRVQTEDGTPPGSHYTLKLGWWSPSTGQQLPKLDSQGQFAGIAVMAGPITVTRRVRPLDVSAASIPNRLKAEFGGLALLGTGDWPASLRQGESAFMTLYWQARTAPLSDHVIALQMRPIGTAGEPRVLAGSAPVHGTYPTSQWQVGEFVADRLALRVPPDTPPGTWALEVMADGGAAQSLARFDVQPLARNWAAPALSQPMSVTLGSQVALVGYDVKSQTLAPHASAGGSNVKSQTVMLTLYWQAVGEMDTDYTVFVHLVDGNGTVWGQHDSVPMNGTYPTTLWQPGEFVTDAHQLTLPPDLPPGDYELEVGLYQVETGLRLAVAGSGDKITLDKISLAR